MNDNEINDIREINEFRGKTFSRYPKNKVKNELLLCFYNSKIENACNWSIELICSGHFQDLWDIILLYMSKYIHIANPKLPIFIEMRFQSFKNIISNGFLNNELGLRNNQKIRKLFAELVCILCVSRKKHAFQNLSIKNKNEFLITEITNKLNAPNIKFAEGVYRSNDPKEVFIPINEFCFHISINSKDSTRASYWVEWLLQYEKLCKQQKIKCECERRLFANVDNKYQNDIIWIIWDALKEEAKREKEKFIVKIINALLNLFCIRYTSGVKSKRKFLIYSAINFLTENVNFNQPLIENKEFIETISNKIDIIYKEIKKNEKKPSTDYLYIGIDKRNLDKTVEKLEKMDKLLNIN